MPDNNAQAAGGPLSALSSMATRGMLAELTRAFQARTGRAVVLESVGGVEAVRRVQGGDTFDVVALARDAIETLLRTGHLTPGTVVDLASSSVVAAVRAGSPRPDISDEAAVRRAVLGARAIGISTGPSGNALRQLFERWAIASELRDRIVTAPPGVPVGELLAGGRVDLGFQQLSELAGHQGIDVVGQLPPAIQIVTTFSAGIGAAARDREAARSLIAFMTSSAAADAKRRHGMVPGGAAEHGG